MRTDQGSLRLQGVGKNGIDGFTAQIVMTVTRYGEKMLFSYPMADKGVQHPFEGPMINRLQARPDRLRQNGLNRFNALSGE